MTHMPMIAELIHRGALFVVNHSGGKDSQAMTAYVRQIVPEDQILVIHAHLPEVEWDGVIDHIEATIDGLPLRVVQAGKTFFQMVERRGMWPSPSNRQCTSDLKRDPIEKEIRRILKERGQSLVVNCMGLRAEESASRARKATFKLSNRNSKAGREWYDWLPIHSWMTEQVFNTIRFAGQTPHWAYAAGMTRLSCVFCIMSSRDDLCTAARLQPDLYRRYVETERRLDHTMNMARRPLEEVTGITAEIDLTVPDFLRRAV
jgi:3'-phosphoadenosine 5'-phosphosulfate sulfotransferase (PAPS reductase)/FAD synthetase